MNKMKFFDKTQLILAISAIASFIVFVIIFIVMSATAETIYTEDGLVDHLAYNGVLESLFSIFVLAHLMMLTWFIARSITFKLREKEVETF